MVERIAPDPGLPLTKGEILVVTGADVDLRRLGREVHPGPRPQVEADPAGPEAEWWGRVQLDTVVLLNAAIEGYTAPS